MLACCRSHFSILSGFPESIYCIHLASEERHLQSNLTTYTHYIVTNPRYMYSFVVQDSLFVFCFFVFFGGGLISTKALWLSGSYM